MSGKLTGGFMGREEDIGKPSTGSVLYCDDCEIELTDTMEQRPCKNGFPFCERCCPCMPYCYPDIVSNNELSTT